MLYIPKSYIFTISNISKHFWQSYMIISYNIRCHNIVHHILFKDNILNSLILFGGVYEWPRYIPIRYKWWFKYILLSCCYRRRQFMITIMLYSNKSLQILMYICRRCQQVDNIIIKLSIWSRTKLPLPLHHTTGLLLLLW